MLSNTMVEHDFWDTLAEEAPSEPEKVQDEPRLLRSGALGAGVTRGSATGEPHAEAAKRARSPELAIPIILAGNFIWWGFPRVNLVSIFCCSRP